MIDAIEESYFTKDWQLSPIPAPPGLEYMPFQKAGIRSIVKYKNILLADEPGLGKTIQAIGAINYLKIRKILIICPAFLRLNWKKELEKWIVEKLSIQIVTSGKDKLMDADITIFSYDLLIKFRPELLKQNFTAIIADESHYLKSTKAKRTKIFFGNKRTRGLVTIADRVILMTGTPITNRPHELYHVLKTLFPRSVSDLSYINFLDRYCVYYINAPFGRVITGAKNQEELNIKLRSGFMVRRLKKDVLKQLPSKQYQIIELTNDHNVKKLIEQEKICNFDIMAASKIIFDSNISQIRKELGVLKVKPAINFIENLLEEKEKIVLFAHHHDVIDGLEKELKKYNPVTITGKTPMKQRDNNISMFQNDKNCRVFIGNIQAAGTGITLTAADTVVFVESSWVPGENDQAADRVHRIGQDSNVMIYFIVFENSLDFKILNSFVGKSRDINKILDERGKI